MAVLKQTNLVLRPAGTETMHRIMAGFICAVSVREWGPGAPRHNNRLQWYQVDFGRPTRVVKFAIQGRQDARQWVTQCYLSYSQDGIHYAEFKENSNRKVRVVNKFYPRWNEIHSAKISE